jgi:alpha-beta hydrolase superfamily lysophospholipase
MALEILHQPAKGTPKGNIVLVHGAWHGAWCWESNFMPWFAEQGYNVYAPSLSGHGKSSSAKNLKWLKISDYVADVWSVVQGLSGDTYLMGHSMGGYIVQKFLEQYGNNVKKAVLIASVPPSGAVNKPGEIIKAIGFWSFLKMNLTLDMYQSVNSPEKVRTLLFKPDTPDSLVQYAAQRVQGEAFLAYMDMLNKKYINPEKINTPLLVVSAGKDWFFPPHEQQVAVAVYKAPQKMYPDAPHNLFATPGWEQVAQDIQAFIEN